MLWLEHTDREDASSTKVLCQRIAGVSRCGHTHAAIDPRELPESQPGRIYSLWRPDKSKRPCLRGVVLAKSHTEQAVLCLSHWTVGGELTMQ